MHAPSKIHPLSSTNDEQTSSNIVFELPDPVLSSQECTALRTHQLFCDNNCTIKASSNPLPLQNIKPSTVPSKATSKIHDTALSSVPKNVWHSIYTSLRRLFFPLSNTISNWFSFSNVPNLKLYCQWAHQQKEHDIIVRIAQKMREDNEKIEEENRLAAKKKSIEKEERKREDTHRDIIHFELKKLSC